MVATNQRKFLRVRRGCQASQRKGLTSGEVRETSLEVWETSGEVCETSGKLLGGSPGLLLSSTVRELLGKSPKNFQASLGNFRGSPGTFQKLGGRDFPEARGNLIPSQAAATRQTCLQTKVQYVHVHNSLRERVNREVQTVN